MDGIIEIRVFKVGHGDNILLKFPGGSWGLIDFYYSSNQTEPPSLAYLKRLGGEIIIDFVHISHYHEDHTKGLDKFFQWVDTEKKVKLKELWLPGTFPPDKIKSVLNDLYSKTDLPIIRRKNKTILAFNEIEYSFWHLDEKIEEFKKRKSLKTLIACQAFNVNTDFNTLCISPCNETTNDISWRLIKHLENLLLSVAEGKPRVDEEKEPHIDENTLSTILIFFKPDSGAGKIKFTFGGDATKKDWGTAFKTYDSAKRDWQTYLQTIDSSFVKVSHHGSKHSSSEEIWEHLLLQDSKDIVHLFFSAGSKKYPNKETLKHIKDTAKRKNSIVKKYSTNQKGTGEKNLPRVPYQKNEENLNRRANTYGGSRQKIISEKFICYTYTYDFTNSQSKVEKE